MKMGKLTEIPGLYEAPDGGYNLRVTAKRGSLKPVERTKRMPGATRAEALIALEKLQAVAEAAAERKERGETNRTLGVFARRWFEVLGAKQARGAIVATTVDEYLRKMEVFFLPYFGHMEVDEVQPSMFEDWLTWMVQQRRPAHRNGRNGSTYAQPPKPYARRTLQYAWKTARTFLDWVTDVADLPRHPMGKRKFEMGHEEPTPKATLTVPEARALVAAAEDDLLFQAMLLVQLPGAMRFSELTGLHWDDLDLDQGAGRIRRSNSRGITGPPKTDGSRRLFVLSDEAVELLKKLKAESTNEIVFPSMRGSYFRSVGEYNKKLKAAAARAGIKKTVTSHVIRRTTNNAVRRVANEVAARAVTGHVTKEMTFHYSDVELAERKDIIARALEGDQA